MPESTDALPPKYDVFISYAHDDNNRLVDESLGWVEQFEKDFQITLREQLGRAPEIWRDSDITPNEDFEKKIFRRLAKAVIFLPVLSRIFINRPYCLRELRSFVENAEKQLATYVGSDGEKKRIFIVEKLPIERDKLPKELQGLGGKFKFHDTEQTLRPALTSKDSRYRDLYYTVLNRLSKTAADLIELAERSALRPGNAPAGPAVYLAETTSELSEARESLRDDLVDRGFEVLPDLELPHGEVKSYTDAVQGYLDRAVLSVHLIGRNYGFIPEGEHELSHVRLQHRLALERGEREPPMQQVIWLATGGDARIDERQKAFIEYLQNDERVHARGELIAGDIESLKTDLLEKLTKLRAAAETKIPMPEPRPVDAPVEHPRVYIICAPADRSSDQLKALRACLYERGCETRLPTEEGTDEEMRKAHEQKLRDFDAFVVYAGAGGGAWLEAQMDDLYRSDRSRTRKPLVKAVYIAPPKTAAKDEFETHEALVVRPGDTFSGEMVEPFLRLCGRPATDRS